MFYKSDFLLQVCREIFLSPACSVMHNDSSDLFLFFLFVCLSSMGYDQPRGALEQLLVFNSSVAFYAFMWTWSWSDCRKRHAPAPVSLVLCAPPVPLDWSDRFTEGSVLWPADSLLTSTYRSNCGRPTLLPPPDGSPSSAVICLHWAAVVELRPPLIGGGVEPLGHTREKMSPLTFCTPLHTGRLVSFFFNPSIYESMIMKFVHICVQYVLIVCLNVLSTLFSYFSLT